MDILNFISWIKGSRVVNSVDPAKTLLPVGLKDNRRDDGYLAGAMTIEDLANQITPTPSYKVFTALLTQSGGDEESDKNATDEFYSGVTYYISSNTENKDFTIYGAPNSNVGTYFLCTQNGIVPNGAQLIYNSGAPVVTVLENTLGNIWFTYASIGNYDINSNGLFIEDKYVQPPISVSGFDPYLGDGGSVSPPSFTASARCIYWRNGIDLVSVITANDGSYVDSSLYNTPIEIRVYN
jgi:hypothetical protein